METRNSSVGSVRVVILVGGIVLLGVLLAAFLGRGPAGGLAGRARSSPGGHGDARVPDRYPGALEGVERAPGERQSVADEVGEAESPSRGERDMPGSDPDAIVGVVLRNDGVAVPGASVAAYGQQWRFVGEAAKATTRADGRGRFRLPVPRNTSFRLWVTDSGAGSASLAPVFAGDRVEVELNPGRTFRVHTKLKETGEPLAGARISVEYAPDVGGPVLFQASALSNADGLATIQDVPPGEIAVEGHAPDVCPKAMLVPASEDGPVELEFTFRRGVRIAGHVFDRSTGLGVSGVRVGEEGPWHAVSGPDGGFRLPPLPAGAPTVALTATHPSYAPYVEYLSLQETKGEMQRDLYLDPACSAVGTVLDATMRPVLGAKVVAIGMYSSVSYAAESQRLERTTDASGRFSLTGLARDVTYFVFAEFEGQQAVGFVRCTDPGKTQMSEPLVLGEGARIRGRVSYPREGERPSVELRLSILAPGRFAPCNPLPVERSGVSPEGLFAFDHVPPGRLRLTARAEGPAFRKELTTVLELSPGETADDVTIDLAGNRPAALQGQVRTESGDSPGQVEVQVLDGADVLSSQWIGGNGEFHFDLEGSGPWTVRVVDPEAFYEETEVPGVLPRSGRLDIVLHELHAEFVLDGHLRDEQGNPVQDAYVGLYDPDTGARASRLGIPDEEGYFRVPNLKNRPYDLQIWDFEGVYEPLRRKGVTPGEPVELTLQRRR